MYLGIILTIVLIIGVGVWAGRKATSAEAFTTGGGKASSWIVCGTLMGTIISGQATVGTAQLAFSFGISAWWFTIGAAVGILLMGILFVKPLHGSGCVTLMEIISRQYGRRVETVGSCLCVLGIFISIMAQVIASSALFSTIFPGVSFLPAALLSVSLMLVYVVFGGVWGAGLGGVVKLFLLYFSATVAGLTVWHLSDGFGGLIGDIVALNRETAVGKMSGLETAEAMRHQYCNLVARGPMKDIGSCLSLVLGVFSTQTYAQALWAGRNVKEARKGAVLSALLIPPIGIACTLVGMYMRAHYVTAAELDSLSAMGVTLPDGVGVLQNSVQAFPVFVTEHLPRFFGGIVLGTLFVTIIGGGSGLALGASTILVRDLVAPLRILRKNKESASKDNHPLRLQRLTIVALLMVALAVASIIRGTFLNDLGFLSLGLRATAVLIPLLCALYFPGRIKRSCMMASMVLGTLMLLVAKICQLPGDPVFWGMGLGILIATMGWNKIETGKRNRNCSR